MKLLEELAEKEPLNANEIIDSFLAKFGIIDLRFAPAAQIVKLLTIGHAELIHRLANDENIIIDGHWLLKVNMPCYICLMHKNGEL